MTGFQVGYGLPGLAGLWLLLARQASEQYLTSSQFFAQLLRQTISRPQAMQVLLGRAALLPLKPATGLLSVQGVVIVVRIGAVVAAPQLHGHILVGVGDALHAQKRGAGRDLEK